MPKFGTYDDDATPNLTDTVLVKQGSTTKEVQLGDLPGGATAFFVAASDASQKSKDNADFLCDGTDDYVEIEAAIAALPSGGGKVILSEGTFDMGNEVHLLNGDSNVTIEGQGASTIIDCTNLADGQNAFGTNITQGDSTAYDINDVTLDDTIITLDTGSEESNFAVGNHIALNTNLVIDAANPTTALQGDYYKVKAITSDSSGIVTPETFALESYADTPTLTVVDMIENIAIKNMKFIDTAADEARTSQGNAQAMYMLYVDGLEISGCIFNKVVVSAIDIRGCLNVKISNCDFNEIYRISGGNIHYGIHMFPGQNILISNCTFFKIRHAFTLSATGADKSVRGYCRGISVINCTSKSATQSHYDTHQGAKNVQFSGLIALGSSDTTANGITCRSPIVISNCHIEAVNGHGVFITDDGDFTTPGGSGTVITGCKFVSCIDGIRVSISMIDVVINGNIFDGCSSNAVQFVADASNTSGDNSVITNNLVLNHSSLSAIRLDSGQNIIISNNRIIASTWLEGNTLFATPTGEVIHNLVSGGGAESGTLTGMNFFGNKGITSDKFDYANRDALGIKNLQHDITTSGTDINFNEEEVQEISISANTTFTTVARLPGKSKILKITTDGTLRTLAFPAWKFVGTKPADQAASKVGILRLVSYSTSDSDIVAEYAVEP